MTRTEDEQEREGGLLAPLNPDSDYEDDNLDPLNQAELSYLSTTKADKSLLEEVCSICCDNFSEK